MPTDLIDKSNINQEVLVILLNRIIEILDSPGETLESVSVDNLDVVSAALRNEIAKVIKSIDKLPDQKDVLKELKSLKEAVSALKMNPTINVEASKVTVPDITIPEIKIPEIKVPEANVTVTIPEINVPTPIVNVSPPVVNVPEVNLTPVVDEIERGLRMIRTNNKSHPLAVRLTDGADWIRELRAINEQQKNMVQFMSDVTYIRDIAGQRVNPATAEGQSFGKLIPYNFDYISLSPADSPTTIVYKQGGASGTTVATLTLTYSGSDISSVTRT
jgi:hypothetical protein